MSETRYLISEHQIIMFICIYFIIRPVRYVLVIECMLTRWYVPTSIWEIDNMYSLLLFKVNLAEESLQNPSLSCVVLTRVLRAASKLVVYEVV